MHKKLKIFCYILFSYDAVAATCPTNYTTINRNDFISIATTCVQTTLGIATAEKIPDIGCTAGATKIKTASGISVPLYRNKHTTPALHIKINNTECYSVLMPDHATNSINISYQNNDYHTAALNICSNLNPMLTPTLIRPNVNGCNWTSLVENKNIQGTSHCSSLGATIGDTRTTLNIDATATQNINCWCRLHSPTISKWVFSTTFASSTNCNMYCAASCAENFAQNTTFRTNIISNISEYYH